MYIYVYIYTEALLFVLQNLFKQKQQKTIKNTQTTTAHLSNTFKQVKQIQTTNSYTDESNRPFWSFKDLRLGETINIVAI